MSQWTDMYRQKLMTPEEAVKVVQSGDWVDYGMGTTQPILLDQALAARRDELQDVKVRMCLSVAPRQIIEQDPERKAFTAMNWYMSGYDRKKCALGQMNFIPMCYRNKPSMYRDLLDVDVALITVGPMDKHGFFNFGPAVSATEAITKKAKKVIVEVNEAMPRVLGAAANVSISAISTASSNTAIILWRPFPLRQATISMPRLPRPSSSRFPTERRCSSASAVCPTRSAPYWPNRT